MSPLRDRLSRIPVLMILAACSGEPKDHVPSDSAASTELTYEDSDGDGIVDAHESLSEDSDGDGTPNSLDTDADGDGLPDEEEAGDDKPETLPIDSDADGVADYLDSDSDNNCILDAEEGGRDTDGDGIGDHADADNDGDGIDDAVEIGVDCALPDSDGDGHADHMDEDSDGDGVGDRYESGMSVHETEPHDTDGDGVADYLDDDADGDGLPDSDESGVDSADAEPRDTDGDGTYDFQDTDADGDGLRDDDEVAGGTDPYDADSDDDGFTDGAETTVGTDPLDGSSVIDGLYVTLPERSDVEQIFSFELSIRRGDVVFLLDSTGSMRETVAALASEFSGIVASLASLLPDAQYGYGTFNDYGYDPFGVAGSDRAFWMRQQITSDEDAVQAALSETVAISTGADDPAAGMEALYQAATGAGYDLDCDGVYSVDTDILPFIASMSDPFGGAGGQFYDGTDRSTGVIGGFGFRDYALPILVYATDNNLRDPDSDDTVYNGVPGGCPIDAGRGDVLAAVQGMGAYLVAVSANSTIGVSQMEDLADATESYGDTDGDGVADDKLVFLWEGTDAEFRETVTGAIEDLVSAIRFHKVSLEIEGDDLGFVTSISPESYAVEGAVEGEIVEFTLSFRGVVAASTEDQLFALKLDVVGDDTVLLDQMDIVIVVPGSSY